MPLLHKLDSSANGLRHAHLAHHHRQPPPAERRHRQFILHVRELRGGAEDADVVQLPEEELFHFATEGVEGGEERETVGVGTERAAEFVVFVVVFAVLDVVATHDADFAEVCILFPLECVYLVEYRVLMSERTYVEKVDFFEEFLFVVLELADHNVVGREKSRG